MCRSGTLFTHRSPHNDPVTFGGTKAASLGSTGKVPYRIFAGKEHIVHRTHGAALTPDETELWISDQVGKKLFIYDAIKMPPVPKGEVELSQGGHGWVSFSLDGKYAWSHTPDVFDARTNKLVATLKDENGTPVSCSKYFEVHFRDGKVVEMGASLVWGASRLPAIRALSAAPQQSNTPFGRDSRYGSR